MDAEAGRREKAIERLCRKDLDAFLVSQIENVRYLTGFTGTSGLLYIQRDGTFDFITDFRYREQFTEQSPQCDLTVTAGGRYLDAVAAKAKDLGHNRIGFESHNLSYKSYKQLETALKGQGMLIPEEDFALSMRMVKDEEEIARLKAVMGLTSRVYESLVHTLKPGMTEKEVATELAHQFRKGGAEKTAFDLIVASGERSALPHGVASDRPLSVGEFVIMDIGCTMKGYSSDITRTVHLGTPDDRATEIYEAVRQAQEAGLEGIRAGTSCRAVDRLARNVIEKKGFGRYFDHGTGHGVGLEVHEAPKLSRDSEEILEENMVVTVEPGIYVPGYGGVRIEDVVRVTRNGYELLTEVPRELCVLWDN